MLFLIWNLILAAISYIISSYLKTASQLKNPAFFSFAALWLLFLPNAPYIITDLIHLDHESSISIIFDGLIISTFTLSGLLFYLFSLKQMLQQLADRGFKKLKISAEILIPFLTGYRIYLGRFERWNSWDLINNPLTLLHNMIATMTDPSKQLIILVTTSSIGIVLIISSIIFNRFKIKRIG